MIARKRLNTPVTTQYQQNNYQIAIDIANQYEKSRERQLWVYLRLVLLVVIHIDYCLSLGILVIHID